MERIGEGFSGAIHLLLAWQSIQLTRGAAPPEDGTREGARTALQLPGGWALVLAGAAVLLVLGAVQLGKTAKGNILRYLDPSVANQPRVQ